MPTPTVTYTQQSTDPALPVVSNGSGKLPVGVGAYVDTDGTTPIPVTAADPYPVTTNPAAGTLIDRSGTITSGGTAQQVMAANPSRKYLLIQNNCSDDIWINFTAVAVMDQPSIRLAPRAAYEMTTAVSTEAVSVIGATTGQAYTAKEI